jgi:hypothetical protein
MSVWLSIGGAICVAVTAVGLVISWRVWRKSGAIRGLRAVAWSLLPLGAYLVGAVRLLGSLVANIVRFAGAFVFSPKSWAGVIVIGLAVVLFLLSGGLPLMNWRKARERRRAAKAEASAGRGPGGPSGPPAVPASRRAPASTRGGRSSAPAADDDDDLGDVQEILRRRGIN